MRSTPKSRARFANERVHVGTVHIEQAAFGVENVGDLVDFVLEHAERMGFVSISAARLRSSAKQGLRYRTVPRSLDLRFSTA